MSRSLDDEGPCWSIRPAPRRVSGRSSAIHLGAGARTILGMHGYAKDREALQGRLRRIEGQIRGIQKMVDEDRYCIDILTQINAVKAALEGVAILLLRDHTEHCVTEAIRAGDGAAKVRELSDAIERLVRG